MTDRLQSALALLDEGLSLYRRNFGGFLAIAASWCVPLAIAFGLLVAATSWMDELTATLLTLGAALLALPATLYLVGGLSRAALDAEAGRQVQLRAALALRLPQVAGMGCFSLVYGILMQIASTMLAVVCICPLYAFAALGIGLIAAVAEGDSAMTALGLALVGVIFLGFYLFILIVGGASYCSLVYALQPWAQEDQPFGVSLQRSFELIGYRFIRNATVWGLAALLLAAAALIVTLAVGLLVPLPLIFALGEDSPVAQAVAASAWMLGLIVVVPPLPIWMALHYRRNLALRQGADLEERVSAWAQGGQRAES